MLKKIKGAFLLLTVLYFVIGMVGVSFASADVPMSIYVNNKKVDFDEQKPYIDNHNRTQVPVRFLTEKLGAVVSWDGKIKRVTIKKDDLTILLDIDSNNAYLNGKVIKMDTNAVLQNNRTVVPLRFVSESFGFDVEYGYKADVRFDSVKRHVIDINNGGDIVLDEKNPFGETIAYVNGDVFNFDEFNMGENGKPLVAEDFQGTMVYTGGILSKDPNILNVWTPFNPVTGMGPKYGFFEGLDVLQKSFYEPTKDFTVGLKGCKYGDYPLLVVNREKGTITDTCPIFVNDETGEGFYKPVYELEDVEGWSISQDPKAFCNNDWWHFGLSNFEDTNLYYPRITINRWYGFTNYSEKHIVTPNSTFQIESVKPLIQFWSNSYEDSKMIWRTLEYLQRAYLFESDRTDEYFNIIDNLGKGSIIQYPDGTRIKLLKFYGQNTTSLAAEFLFMSMPFEFDKNNTEIEPLLN